MSSNWSNRRVGDFATRKKIINDVGEDLPPLSVTKDRGVLLQSAKYKKRVATDPRKYVVVEDGDFAFDPMSLYYGALGRVGGVGRGLISPDYAAFTVDATVDPTFLEYKLRSPEMIRVYERVAQAGNQYGKRRRVYWSVLAELPVLLPPLPEQRAIAVTLKSVDNAIAAEDAVIEQLDTVRRRLALDLVTRGVARGEGCVSVGPLTCPARWQVMRIEQVVSSCDYGLSCAMNLDASGVACLRMGNVQAGDVVLDDLKYVPRDEASDGLLLAPGDVLFNRTNSKDLVGKVGLFRGSGRPVTFASYLLRLRVKTALVSGEWVAAVLNLDAYQRYIRSMATPGISQVNVNRTRLLAIEIPVPPAGEQRAIIDALGAASERASMERAVVAERRRVKAALVDALLGGKLRVRNAA